jgi:hypothetical protein
MNDWELEPTKWKIFGERLVDENPFIRLSIASVGLPDGTEFEQYVTAFSLVISRDVAMLLQRFPRCNSASVGRATDSARLQFDDAWKRPATRFCSAGGRV